MGKKHKKPRSAPGLGATYTNAVRGATILSPLTDTAITAMQQQSVSHVVSDLQRKGNSSYAAGAIGNVAISLVDAYVDKRMGQAAAISRLSVTALAPELYRGAIIARGLRGGPQQWNADLAWVANGFDPRDGSLAMREETGVYRALKHGGQLVRAVLKHAPGGESVKKALRFAGVTA